MRELQQIVTAFEELAESPAALATVVGVEGSSYRQPGARMLIRADGRSWGGVSGGCLESDVARRGRIVIETSQPQVGVYETADDDGSPGASLGCGGRIEILIQRVDAKQPGILAAMTAAVRQRKLCRATTVIRSQSGDAGNSIIQIANQPTLCNIADPILAATIERELKNFSGEARNVRLPSADVLLESIIPPQSLFIFGDGTDVIPMVEFAKGLGWHVTVISTRGQFAGADVVTNDIIEPTPDSAAVIMNHNLRRDTAALKAAVRSGCRYVGLLGPRRRSERMMQSLGITDSESHRWIFPPMGLDIGAKTPEQIALAVLAEILAVINDRDGGPLRRRNLPLHQPAEHP
jgi:xanthine dehydrogenase accessory factor